MLTGDLNGLSTIYLQTQSVLYQSVNVPTHNSNILDMLLTNCLDLFHVQVGQSPINTKHKALIVNAKSLNEKSVQRESHVTQSKFEITIFCILLAASSFITL